MALKTLEGPQHDRYKWIALTNTTLGVFMATVNSSIILISLPAIFRGVGIDPLSPGNVATCCGCCRATYSSRPCS
jgi:hypothetical protein